jgi:hypothetical protein
LKEKTMAPEKAPKKAAKKAAKKAPKHGDKKHEAGNDLRKAYEHLGRLGVLKEHLPATVVGRIGVLTKLAETSLMDGEDKTAAHLLRAGEHLAFGTLASKAKEQRLSEAVVDAIHAEFEHLSDKAEEHRGKHGDAMPEEVAALYDTMLEAANEAFNKGAYRRALEFARGAEALAHVRGEEAARLEDGGKKAKKLKA